MDWTPHSMLREQLSTSEKSLIDELHHIFGEQRGLPIKIIPAHALVVFFVQDDCRCGMVDQIIWMMSPRCTVRFIIGGLIDIGLQSNMERFPDGLENGFNFFLDSMLILFYLKANDAHFHSQTHRMKTKF